MPRTHQTQPTANELSEPVAAIFIQKKGDQAELEVIGSPRDVGQLMDALMRRFGLVEGASA